MFYGDLNQIIDDLRRGSFNYVTFLRIKLVEIPKLVDKYIHKISIRYCYPVLQVKG